MLILYCLLLQIQDSELLLQSATFNSGHSYITPHLQYTIYKEADISNHCKYSFNKHVCMCEWVQFWSYTCNCLC